MVSWSWQLVAPWEKEVKRMAESGKRYSLVQDRKGMMWDLWLYVPTVIFLVLIAIKVWYGPYQDWTYVLVFMATFFAFAGANRILKTRLMILPGAPTAIDVDKQRVRFELRNGKQVDLVKSVRFFGDFVGKSFAVTGMDMSGKKQQYVFHRGQFADEGQFKDVKSFLQVYK